MQNLTKPRFSYGAIFISLSIICIVFSGCKKDNPGLDQVWMQGMAFNPTTITVAVNATVTWTNKDENTYTITSNDSGLFDSGPIIPGSIYNHQFTQAGTYNYHNTISYPNMTGTVIVQ